MASSGVPSQWFADNEVVGEAQGAKTVWFEHLTSIGQVRIEDAPIAVTEFDSNSIDEEAMVFDLINFGGVPQGLSDL